MAAGGEVNQNVLIKFAQKLAGNEKKYRDRAVKKLRKWLEVRSSSEKACFTHEDFLKIWKGLHYCMWMSDKPLIQEELADTIASLIHNLKTVKQALLFIDVHLETECREWFNIDRLRLDKFMMMIRRFFRQSLILVKNNKWKKSVIRQLVATLQKTVLSVDNESVPDGMRYHVTDIYLDELERVGAGEVSSDRVLMFLEPYCQLLTQVKMPGLLQHIQRRIFGELLQWEEKRIQAQEVDSDEEEVTKNKKPEKQHLQVNYKALGDHLFELAASDKCLSRNRKPIYNLVTKLRDIAEGILPKQEVVEDVDDRDFTPKEIRAAAVRLKQFEEKLSKDTRSAHREKQKKLKLKRKRAQHQAADGENGGKINGVMDDGSDNDESTPVTKKPKMEASDTSSEAKTKKSKQKNKKHKNKNHSNVEKTDASSTSSQNITEETEEHHPVPKDTLELLHCGQLNKPHTEENMFTEIKFSADTKSSPESKSLGNITDIQSSHSDKKKIKKNKTPKLRKDKSEKTPKVELEENSDDIPVKSSVKSDKKSIRAMKEEWNSLLLRNIDFNMSMEDASDDAPSPAVKKEKKNKSPGNPMINFTKPTKTPPAFVKRAIGKLSTPKSEPKKHISKIMKAVQAPGSAPDSGKKKVIFAMNKNQAQDFNDSLLVSPVLPFDPKILPEQSILKLSPFAPSSASKALSPRKKLFKKRRRASDFF